MIQTCMELCNKADPTGTLQIRLLGSLQKSPVSAGFRILHGRRARRRQVRGHL